VKHAIVTGATGFVGRHLVSELVNGGVNVTAVVREISAKTNFLSDFPSVTMVVCPLGKISELPQLLEEVKSETVFYHLAWEGTAGKERSDVNLQLKNVSYTIEALKAAQSMECEAFVGAGSIMEYESTSAIYDVNNVPSLGNIYSTAKLTAHYMGRVTAANSKIRFVWPYITNAYGEKEISPRFLNTTVKKILSGEEIEFSASTQIYDFIHVSDVARAFSLLGELGKDGQTYCVGSGAARPLKEYIIQLRDLLDPVAKFIFGDKPGISLDEKYFDTRLLVADTGFCPKISFKEGILRLKEQWGNVHEK
jgi:nucleoside-diphosphate-sugar epimerase